ncbi:MAG: RNA chaperone Hfq [Pseudomonadales bacterium]|nr:RNA chaperone Hfq [Pseudomonadales bacterium]MCP5203254.1 RNA chaperone Hfq [Pseudomonadales bacterium]
MGAGENIQERFLGVLRDKRIPVSVFLKNGIKLQGTIDSFDLYSVMLKNVGTQMVYKHAISTILPSSGERTLRGRSSSS